MNSLSREITDDINHFMIKKQVKSIDIQHIISLIYTNEQMLKKSKVQ